MAIDMPRNHPCAFILFALPLFATAQVGLSPDHLFTFLPTIWSDHTPHSLTMDPQGRLVIFGEKEASVPANSRVFFLRALPEAEPDSTFDEEGFTEHNVCTSYETAIDVGCLPDGRIMALGLEDYPNFFNDGIYLLRLNVDGSIDSTFWEDGKFIFQWNGEYTQPRAMVIQPDGGTVIAGMNNDGDSFLVRLDPSGAFDTAFGVNGGVALGIGDQWSDDAADVCALPDGSLLLTGWYRPTLNANRNLYIQRVLPTGVLDPDYGDGGRTLLPDAAMVTLPANIAAASDGSAYVASYRFSSVQDVHQLIVQHFLPDGTYDTAFGTNGVVVVPVVGNYLNQQPAGLAVLPNDLVVVTPRIDQAGVVCLLPNGQFAPGFGNNGILLDPDFVPYQFRNLDLVADGDGNVWVLTSSNFSTNVYTIAYKVIMDLTVGTVDAHVGEAAPMLLGTVVTGAEVELQWRMQASARLGIDLFASDGRRIAPVWSGEAAAGEHRRTLPLPDGLAPGTYLLRFATANAVTSVRFVKH
jgi:uncharacterized delta-60 repeat protein